MVKQKSKTKKKIVKKEAHVHIDKSKRYELTMIVRHIFFVKKRKKWNFAKKNVSHTLTK